MSSGKFGAANYNYRIEVIGMLTWKLWRALCSPPYAHPLFQRTITTQLIRSRLRRLVELITGYLVICTLATFIWPLLFANPAIIVLVIVACSNTVYSLTWAFRISTAIAREYELETYDLLCLQPPGALGVGWLLCTGNLYRSPFFRGIRFIMPIVSISVTLALVIALAIPILLSISSAGQFESMQLFMTLVSAPILAIAFFYVDHVQSLLLANLIGMFTPTFLPDRLYAGLWSVSGFLALQIAVYLVTLIVSFIILPTFYDVSTLHASLILSALRLLIFYALREGLILAIWHLLKQRLNANTAELGMVFKVAQ